MPNIDPSSSNAAADFVSRLGHAGTYAAIVFVAAWGGVVSWIQNRKRGVARPFSFVELIGEITTASFCGLLACLLCQEAGLSIELTAAIAGVAGHMGSRGLFLLERALVARYLPRTVPADVSHEPSEGAEQDSQRVG